MAIFRDEGERPDSSDAGPNWDVQVTGSDLQIVDGGFRALTLGATARESVNILIPGAPQFAEVRFRTFAGAGVGRLGVILRAASPGTNTHYAIFGSKNEGTLKSAIRKHVAGVLTDLVTENATAWGAGDVLRAEIRGTALALYRNGVLLLSTTDSEIASGRIGLYVRDDGSLADSVAESFLGGDLATRLYFSESLAADLSPTISATDWEHINTVRRRLLIAPDASALATTAYTPDGADHLVDGDAHHRQYVSDPLAPQTIAGNVQAQFQCLEANAGNNLFITLKIFACGSDGTVKETLLAITRDTTLELATALTNRTVSSIALTSAAVESGDRLVVEVGLGGTPTAAGGVQGHNGSIRWGGSASGGDLPENDTDTGTTLRPWIEFDSNLVFERPVPPTIVNFAPTRAATY